MLVSCFIQRFTVFHVYDRWGQNYNFILIQSSLFIFIINYIFYGSKNMLKITFTCYIKSESDLEHVSIFILNDFS